MVLLASILLCTKDGPKQLQKGAQLENRADCLFVTPHRKKGNWALDSTSVLALVQAPHVYHGHLPVQKKEKQNKRGADKEGDRS